MVGLMCAWWARGLSWELCGCYRGMSQAGGASWSLAGSPLCPLLPARPTAEFGIYFLSFGQRKRMFPRRSVPNLTLAE